MMNVNQQYYILDNVLSMEECLSLYHSLQETSAWSLSRLSKKLANRNLGQFSSFPGFNVETNGEIHNEYFSGYFRSMMFRVKSIIKKEHGIRLPATIKRIHLGAKNSQSKTEFHVDSENENAWTVLGFLNPVWDSKNGGEFFVENNKIEYKSARFVIFKSNLKHNGGFVTNEQLSNWRISLNIILLDEDE